MHEVDMLCDNVGIINTGKLVAYNTPQGLKDDLLTEQRRDFDRQVSNTLSEIHKENMNNLTGVNKVNITQNHFNNNINLKNMSFLLDNSNDEIINSIKSVEHVQNLEISNNGRINLKINSFDDSVVNNVIKTIIAKDGKINSIFTEEPSLEDVFINVTSEVDDDARA
jgi:ABC-2 type transport system ATP-binding protein